jgi:hypothetical protein
MKLGGQFYEVVVVVSQELDHSITKVTLGTLILLSLVRHLLMLSEILVKRSFTSEWEKHAVFRFSSLLLGLLDIN